MQYRFISSSKLDGNAMQQDKKVDPPQNEEEPTLSRTAKFVLAAFMVLLVTLFFLMWKGLGVGPIITPRSSL